MIAESLRLARGVCQAVWVQPRDRVQRLLTAASAYTATVSNNYDEVVNQVAARAAEVGSLSKLDLGALTAWKRMQANTPWMGRLMGLPDAEVRLHTGRAVAAARDESMSAPEAGAAARRALLPLPGFTERALALASAACFAAAPNRLAVYDRWADRGLKQLELPLKGGRNLYGRYLTLLEQCRGELSDHGHVWSARDVDVALYQHGPS